MVSSQTQWGMEVPLPTLKMSSPQKMKRKEEVFSHFFSLVIIFIGLCSGITRTSSTTSSDNGSGGHQEGRSTESVFYF